MARGSSLDTFFIKIDFKKCYDRVEWPFILAMLKTLGLGPLFMGAIATLIAKASYFLSTNVRRRGPFHSIHQGSPLVAALYVMVDETLRYLIAHKLGQQITKSIYLPKPEIGQLINGHFINDSFLVIPKKKETVGNTMECLQTFCMTFGPKIQRAKTQCYK